MAGAGAPTEPHVADTQQITSARRRILDIKPVIAKAAGGGSCRVPPADRSPDNKGARAIIALKIRGSDLMSVLELHARATRAQASAGQITRACFGELEISSVAVAASLFRHGGPGVANAETAIFLVLEAQECVKTVTLQDGREARLGAGDFTLCDTTRPYDVQCDGTCRILVVSIPRTLLLRYVPFPEELTAVGMPARESMNGLVSDYLRNLWIRFPQGAPIADAWQVCQATMSLIGGAYERLLLTRSTRRSAASVHRARIRSYIEQHLTDPDLTPTSIAAGCQINVRYMHRLQALENETLARYILRRRLEECARELAALQRRRSITEIAFLYGFKSATHFGRAFRDRYGVSPGKYRPDGLAPAPAACERATRAQRA
jgi:AraC family transcriptional regulator, positive regulator of tynA and feaB